MLNNNVGTIEGATPLNDLSGLKVKIPNITRRQLYEVEAENIAKVTAKYLVKSGYTKSMQFDVIGLCNLHKEMFDDVWRWAGEYRSVQTNIGSSPTSIHQDILILSQDVEGWKEIKMDFLEQAVRLHHRAVQIHPFENGNGRWSRMLSNIWLKKNGQRIILWPDNIDVVTNVRTEYLQALRQADGMNYESLMTLHKTYQSN